MKVAVYSVKDYEKPFLEDFGNNRHELRLIEDSLNINNISKARGCRANFTLVNDDFPLLRSVK